MDPQRFLSASKFATLRSNVLARQFPALALFTLLLGSAVSACQSKPQHFDTRVEIQSLRTMGGQQGKAAPSLIEFELRFVDCPGEVKRVVRGDKALAACAGGFKVGETVPAGIDFAFDRARENYRGDLVKLGSCEVKLDPKEDANYESVQVCRDLKASGVVVGVHCDKKREGELLDKCPWLKRI